MGRPRFLADHDFNEYIIEGLWRVERTIDCVRAREIGLAAVPDAVLLEAAANDGRITLSHDVNTMIAAAIVRIVAHEPMPGLFVAHQTAGIGEVIDALLLIWTASEADEWRDRVEYLP